MDTCGQIYEEALRQARAAKAFVYNPYVSFCTFEAYQQCVHNICASDLYARQRGSFAKRALGFSFEKLMCPILCVACNKRCDSFICKSCFHRLLWIDPVWSCPNCSAPSGWLTCSECSDPWGFASCHAVYEFSSYTRQLILQFKDQRDTRLSACLAALLACFYRFMCAAFYPNNTSVSAVHSKLIFSRQTSQDICRAPPRLPHNAVCFIPATRKAYRYRGFDHMELVTQLFAYALGISYCDVLVRPYALDQRRLSKQQRVDNLTGTISVLQDTSNKRVLVLDDVITTGASMREAARALKQANAVDVSALAFARVW